MDLSHVSQLSTLYQHKGARWPDCRGCQLVIGNTGSLSSASLQEEFSRRFPFSLTKVKEEPLGDVVDGPERAIRGARLHLLGFFCHVAFARIFLSLNLLVTRSHAGTLGYPKREAIHTVHTHQPAKTKARAGPLGGLHSPSKQTRGHTFDAPSLPPKTKGGNLSLGRVLAIHVVAW